VRGGSVVLRRKKKRGVSARRRASVTPQTTLDFEGESGSEEGRLFVPENMWTLVKQMHRELKKIGRQPWLPKEEDKDDPAAWEALFEGFKHFALTNMTLWSWFCAFWVCFFVFPFILL
jgi:hypothetical protein